MKILRVSISYPREEMPGIGLSAFYHAHYSSEENMIITSYREQKKIDCKPGLRIVEIPLASSSLGSVNETFLRRVRKTIRKSLSQIGFLFRSTKHIREYKPDVVHIYSPIPIMVGVYCKFRFKSRLVMSLHGTDVERVVSSKIFSFLLRIPDAVLLVSDSMERKLQGKKGIKRVFYMGNGFNSNEFYNMNLHRENKFVHVASLRWQKGQEYLIEAFASFCKEYPAYKLVIFGDGELKSDLLELCKRKGISNNVIFEGICSHREINNELNTAKAFILSSVIEGSPKVVLEALATGTPVISTDVGNVKSTVKDAGIVVPSKDSESLYRAMKEVVETDAWNALSIRAEKYSLDYTWDKVAKRLEDIYSKITHFNRREQSIEN